MTLDQKIERVKSLVTIESGIDISDKSRERDVVEARAVYYKILRDVYKLSLTRIARSLGYNHATILHALNNYDAWSSFSNNMVTCHNNVKQTILDTQDEYLIGSDVLALKKKIEILELSNQELTRTIVRNLRGKRESVHKLVMEIPESKINKAYIRIDALINCL